MRTTIGKYDYIRNEQNVIQLFIFDGTVDKSLASFISQDGKITSSNMLISEIATDFAEIYANIENIFNSPLSE